MVIRDLLELAPQVVSLQIEIRSNGRYVYKWVVGKHIRLHSGYSSRGYRLEEGERIDYNDISIQFPATFIAVDPRELDRETLDLKITDMRLWRPSDAHLYGKESGWEPIEAICTCDIGDWLFRKPVKSTKVDIDKDQLSLEDFLEADKEGE